MEDASDDLGDDFEDAFLEDDLEDDLGDDFEDAFLEDDLEEVESQSRHCLIRVCELWRAFWTIRCDDSRLRLQIVAWLCNAAMRAPCLMLVKNLIGMWGGYVAAVWRGRRETATHAEASRVHKRGIWRITLIFGVRSDSNASFE